MALAEEKDKAAAHVARPNLGGSRVRARMGGGGSARRGQHGGRTRACIEFFSISFFFWGTLLRDLPHARQSSSRQSSPPGDGEPGCRAYHARGGRTAPRHLHLLLATYPLFAAGWSLIQRWIQLREFQLRDQNWNSVREGPGGRGKKDKGRGGALFPGWVCLRSESGRQGRQCLCPQPGLCRRT